MMHFLAWGVLAILLPLAYYMVGRAETRERHYLMEPLVGFAPTYAMEMARMGHANIGPETDPNDAGYLQLIEAQKGWLQLNRQAASIYTYRLDPLHQYQQEEGEPVQFVVCAEVDYDRNGIYEGEDEQRVGIGENFEDTDLPMLEVFKGKSTFNDVPSRDEWGEWIGAYAPVYGPDGKVEAAIGVDFDAREWRGAIRRARATVLAYFGLIVFALAGAVSGASSQLLIQSNRRDRELAAVTGAAKEKFETLVNSIEGVVFEWEPETGRYRFMSAQSGRILGRDSTYWEEEPGRWESLIHPDDRQNAIASRSAAGQVAATYSLDYRVLGPENRIIWIRETGNPVMDETGKVVLLRGVLADITEHKQHADEIEQTHRQLVDTSRRAGMAEVATGVLHNVGNVLNSVNVASTLIHQRLNGSRLGTLGQLADLLKSAGEGLPEFFATDPRGKIIPGYLSDLFDHLRSEQSEVLTEVDGLVKNIEHIKNIVDLQQNYARTGGTMEPLDIVDLTEDALGINSASLTRHRIRLIKRYEEGLPAVLADRSKVLQILVNLIRNGKHAVDDAETENRLLGIAIERCGEDKVRIVVADTGVGISAENMSKLFTHGFTTRKDGHGFGLHSSEAAAREMNGSLTANSSGVGQGATFILELGIAPDPASSLSAAEMLTALPR